MSVSKIVYDVARMNVDFGNQEGSLSNIDWEKLKTQVSCIPEELDELAEAIKTKNSKEVRDAICDILVFTLGAAHIIGMDVDADMEEVYDSNMSKFCETQEQLDATIKKYADMGVVVHACGQFPKAYVRSSFDQTVGNKTYPKDKFLKGVNFFEPKFEV